MDIIQGLIQPPKVQSVDETIPTLCDTLENATLLSDRRSAVLALKSFSRQYREYVVASGLKPLVQSLKRDSIDEDMVKAILETLLILFIRGEGDDDLTRNWISQQSRLQNGKYPSPLVMKQEELKPDQFSMWIADALTQNDECIHMIIGLLSSENFHIRLYIIQLLEAVVATRPSRARNAIISLPTGISSLVSLLDDIHEQIRDEAILLLMAVVNDSSHVQKVVAFENIFERLFVIIEEEGGLRGSLVVNDCLSLINNILKYNTSNQTLFLETGNIPKLLYLLNEPLSDKEEFFWNDQRVININTALDIVALMVEPGNTTTKMHQDTLVETNALMVVLRLSFYHNIPKNVRPIALLTAADMIKGNELAQSGFGNIDVPYFNPSLPTDNKNTGMKLVPVVNLLTHWALYANSVHTFPTRSAATALLKSYFEDNSVLQLSFIKNQITEYNNGSTFVDESDDTMNFKCNLFEVLLEYDPDIKLNPYKLYFATDLMMYFFQPDNPASSKIRELSRLIFSEEVSNKSLQGNKKLNIGQNADIGKSTNSKELKNYDEPSNSTNNNGNDSNTDKIDDEDDNDSDDDEKLDAIQTIGELLLTALNAEDIRIPITYLSMLIFWLYGDMEAVNCFLSNKSIIQSLLSFSYQLEGDDITLKCLVTILLGIAYEFSSKDSPFPRKSYFAFVTKTLGQDNYASRVRQFKEDSLYAKTSKEFDILKPLFDETGLPKIYFNTYFFELIDNNYYRIRTALAHSPDVEPFVELSFENFEQIQEECKALKQEINTLGAESQLTIEKLKNDLDALKESHENVTTDFETAKEEYLSVSDNYNKTQKELKDLTINLKVVSEAKENLEKINSQQSNKMERLNDELTQNKEKLSILHKTLDTLKKEKAKAEEGINKMGRELMSLTKEKDFLSNKEKELEKKMKKNSDTFMKEKSSLQQNLHEAGLKIKKLSENLESANKVIDELNSEKRNTDKNLEEWKARFQSHDALVPKLTEKLKSLANSFKDLQIQNEKITEELQASKNSHNTEVSTLTSQVALLNEKISTLISEKNVLNSQIIELEHSLSKSEILSKEALESSLVEKEANEKQILELTTSINELSADKKKNIETLDNLRTELSSCQEDSKTKDSTIINLNNTIKIAEDKLASSESRLEELIKQKGELAKQKDELAKQKDELHKLNVESKDELQKTNDKIAKLSGEHKELKLENTSLIKKSDDCKILHKTEVASLQEKIKSLDGELKRKDENFHESEEKLVHKNDIMKDKLSTQESLLKQLESDKESLKSNIESHLEKIEEQKQEILKLQDEYSSLESDSLNSSKEKENVTLLLDEANNKNENLKSELEKARADLIDLKSNLDETNLNSQRISEEKENLSKKIKKFEDEILSIKKERETSKQKTQEQIMELQKSIKSRNEEFERERKLLNEGSNTATKEYSAKVSELEDKLDALKAEYSLEKDKLVTNSDSLRESNERLEDQLEEKSNELHLAKEDAKIQNEKIKNIELKLKTQANSNESKLKDYMGNIDSLKKELLGKEKALGILQSQLESQLSVVSEKDTEIADIRKQLKNSNIKLNEKEVSEKLAKSAAEDLAAIKESELSKIKEDMKTLRSDYDGKIKVITSLELKLSEFKTLSEDYSSLKDKLGNLENDLKDSKASFQEKKTEAAEYKQTVENLAKEKEKLTNDLSNLTERVNSCETAIQLKDKEAIEAKNRHEELAVSKDEELIQLRKEIEELKASNSKLHAQANDKSEVDELMILVNDLDEKNTKYLAKLEELGITLSSDEEDTDDEEEEDASGDESN
ncbi:hypothetical protein TBLA_0I02900 [Henningerozyma blattae CBS 6284]|uniref:Vesicle tethering protein Uso1/P115-like head domain-containing protein n=1 Tax=Henningerozyma blattae (strain ATCC 34711 / CBS 6284 / DSM 70876 / NBRC 10599 / NRRL Y-10934 / UCD 77-7) TaxID=1071380 RepID=I2H994_HENB6|nr:hypothetical protein TBLA_0I02900 [Tetrapisispora blattae CBS 6284]CCH62946.1 hypothetical protein TBLA_0I02900 [Tetrapisispora blattae CBS 6284]